MTQGRGAALISPGTVKGKASRGPGDQRRDLGGAATADLQCSNVMRACREEGKKTTRETRGQSTDTQRGSGEGR